MYVVLGKIILASFIAVALLVPLLAEDHKIYALTKEEAAKQYAEREQAKAQAKANAHPEKPMNVKQYAIKIITIQLSNSCLTLVKNNITSGCPGYERLIKYDTTNPSYSGKFIEKNGHMYRDFKGVKTANYYLTAVDYIICVDCKHLPLTKYKQVSIVPSLDLYKKDSDKRIVNNTIISYHSRGVDPDCQVATIKYDDFLLNDTINYLKSDCTKTDIDTKIIEKRPLTKHDLSTSPAYKYQKWLAEAKKLKTENCLKSDKC